MNETLSHSTKKQQGALLTIVVNTEVGEPCMFGKGIYLSEFYCPCYEIYIPPDISEEHVSKYRYQDLNE